MRIVHAFKHKLNAHLVECNVHCGCHLQMVFACNNIQYMKSCSNSMIKRSWFHNYVFVASSRVECSGHINEEDVQSSQDRVQVSTGEYSTSSMPTHMDQLHCLFVFVPGEDYQFKHFDSVKDPLDHYFLNETAQVFLECTGLSYTFSLVCFCLYLFCLIARIKYVPYS